MTGVPCTRTPYGFKWGEADVACQAEIMGNIFLGVSTPRQSVTIRVTPTGLIRVDRIHKKRLPRKAP